MKKTAELNRTNINYLTVIETHGKMFSNQTHETLTEALELIAISLKKNPSAKFYIYKCKRIL